MRGTILEAPDPLSFSPLLLCWRGKTKSICSLVSYEMRGLVGLSQLSRWNNFVDKQSLRLLRCCYLLSQYPEGLGKYDYIPGFAIRGLHYDVQKVSCTKFSLLGFVFRCGLVLVEMLSVTVYNNVYHQPISPCACAFCCVGGSCLQTSQGEGVLRVRSL